MVAKDNTFKDDPSGHSTPEAVNQAVDANSPISLAEANQMMDADEGNIEEQIHQEKTQGEKEIAPDLEQLKKEQAEKKKELEQAKDEVTQEKAEVTEKPEEKKADRYANKSVEDIIEMHKNAQAQLTKLSQKEKEYQTKIKELEEVNNKIEEIERQAVSRQQATPKLPEFPPDELFYDDPVKYNKQMKEYNEAYIRSMVAPLRGQAYHAEKQKAINALKESTKESLIPYSEVESEVESRLKKNPSLFNQHGIRAREFVYNEIRSEKLPEKEAEIREKTREEIRAELEKERAEMNNAQVMSSDITTQRRESKPIDFSEQLAETDDPEQVIRGIKAKYKIRNDI